MTEPTPTQTGREWVPALTADHCEAIFRKALADGDTTGVEASLRLLAVKDPHRAHLLFEGMRLALDVVKVGPATVAGRLRAEADRLEATGGIR